MSRISSYATVTRINCGKQFDLRVIILALSIDRLEAGVSLLNMAGKDDVFLFLGRQLWLDLFVGLSNPYKDLVRNNV